MRHVLRAVTLDLEPGDISTIEEESSVEEARHASDSRLFLIEYDDWRHVLKTDNRLFALRRADLSNLSAHDAEQAFLVCVENP